jgi:hypothetical protein
MNTVDLTIVTFFTPVSIAPAGTGALGVSPLLPGDSLDDIRFLLRGSVRHVDVLSGVDVTVSGYMTTERQTTAAGIANGMPLFQNLSLPMEAQAANGATDAYAYLSFTIPTIFTADQRFRRLGLVITAPTNVGLAGSVLAKVFRRAGNGG